MTTPEKLASLRELMQQHNLNAYIIAATDPHQGEYIPAHWQTRQWFSGFSGSAGTLVVTHDFAGLWTDSRYFIQAEEQLHGSGISLVKLIIPHTPEYIDWLLETMPAGSRIGLDGKVVAAQLVDLMQKQFNSRDLYLDTLHDLPGMIWEQRPPLPSQPVFAHDEHYAGKSRPEKLNMVRQRMQEQAAGYQLLTSLDDIAWLLNLRGEDVDYNPVFVSYCLISATECFLFIDAQKVPDELQRVLKQEGIILKPYDKISEALQELPANSSLLYSSAKTSHFLSSLIPSHCRRIDDISIVTRLKACKNPVEASHFRKAMIRDGVALVKFFRWLEENLGKTTITELTVDEQLTTFRKQQEGFVGNSFATIAGYLDHGAIIHYSATPQTANELKAEGLLLLDSGGQYFDGTTDITRTVNLGKPSREERHDFTLVLKGHIELSRAVFPAGTKGFHLDTLARIALWKDGKNYGHGTGHGVGFFLNVHEGPAGISPNPALNYPLEPGMMLTNEPGLYRQGHYGIRTENLLMVIPHADTEYGSFLAFETLTLFPYELALIDTTMLCHEEKQWINHYHQMVFERLEPYLNEDEKKWLSHKTRAI